MHLGGSCCNTCYWHLKNVCSTCTYKLQGEDAPIFNILVMRDGNNSLKHIIHKEADEMDADGKTQTQGVLKESWDDQEVGGDYYLCREQVDCWAKDHIMENLQHIVPGSDFEDNNPCATQWSNMINDMTSRMWSIFDKTGMFLALCRHGLVLLVTDIVDSGEL
jgi:hypothetical protein